jgi:hypothetical protein
MNESYRKKISHRKKNNELWTVFSHFLFGPPDCLDKWRKEEEDYAVEATTDAPAGVVSLRVCVVDRAGWSVVYFYGGNKMDDGNHP